ncbi:DNA polymerase delta small subunit [Babesia caballi]|uniref:DNA polymerase delta small subunit n=1 Tax=Babesia caballi TaxID=5871 RepID=A0AAV4LL92_BABCB|nr:DNA polymerase delta small subunit [Babesia caballi]
MVSWKHGAGSPAEEVGDRTHLLHQSERLNEAMADLGDSRKMLEETNEIGTNVMSKLLSQREAIIRSTHYAEETGALQRETRSILRAESWSDFYTKAAICRGGKGTRKMGEERSTCTYDNELSKRFRMVGVPYANQYFTLSAEKLESLRPCFRAAIERRWPEAIAESNGDEDDSRRYVHVKAIKDAKARCVIIGALFKDMKLRPSPLEEYSEEVQLKQKLVAKYASEDDRLFIEDQSIRMGIRGTLLNPQKFVTGLIIALKGIINDQGEFDCEDYLLPGPPLSIPLPPSSGEKYLALVSGLGIADVGSSHNALLLLKHFLMGNTPLTNLSSKVARLVVAGNGIGKCDVTSLVDCDVYISQLAATLPVDLMPGDADPSNRNLPQQPIHPCFFEHSKRYGTFQSTTNPHFFSVDGVRFLGTSGQAVKGMCDFSELTELEALELTVKSRCIAPTAPDTLGCHPEAGGFTLAEDSEFPHVIFSGNASQYATAIVGDSGGSPRVICVPSFVEQPSIVLVSLATLEATLVKLA